MKTYTNRETIFQIDKNKETVIRVTKSLYKNKVYYDFREWFDDGTEYRPTKKGFIMSEANFGQLKEKLAICETCKDKAITCPICDRGN